MTKIPCTIGSDPGGLVIRDKGVIHLSCDCLPQACMYYIAQNLATPTCHAKTLPLPILMLFSTAPPSFTGFHDCDYQSLEGVDSRAKDTILSKVELA